MNPKDLQQYLDVIVKSLSPLGEKAIQAFKSYYALSIRQVYIDGFECMAVATLFAGATVATLRWWKRGSSSISDIAEKGYTMTFASPRTVARNWMIVGLSIAGLICLICAINGFDCLANADYWALKHIIQDGHK